MHVIDLSQRTPEWLAWRAAGVSASDVPTLIGVSPYKTPWRLWAEKTGLLLPEDLSGNPFVQRGIALEDEARRDFEERHGTFLLPLCGEAEGHPVIRASFDGLDDNGEPVELKVPGPKTYREVLELGEAARAVKLYWPQLQTQLHVCGAARGYLVFYQGPGVVQELEVPRDEAFIATTLVPACLAFWESVQRKREPPRDPERDLFTPRGPDLDLWTTLAGEYRTLAADKAKLERQAKTAKAGLDAIEERLVALMGHFVLAETAGLRVLRYAQAGSIDYKEALSGLVPELDPTRLEDYRRAPSARVKVTPIKQEKASAACNAKPAEAARVEAEAETGFYF
jgi:putative phage-type endonuclease